MELFTGIPIQFFELENGNSPVIDWINSLPLEDQNKIDVEVKRWHLDLNFEKGIFAV